MITLDVSEDKAVEDLLHSRAALEAHSAAVEVSGHRTTALMFEQRDEIVSAALSSPEVKTRARDIAKFAKAIDPAVPSDLQRILDPDDLIAASHLMKAESVLRDVAAKLDAVLGADFDPLPLLWIDPTDVTDWVAFDKALKGIRCGHTFIPVWELGPTGASGISTSAMGIVSASASGVTGTRFTLATSYTEYERRRSVYERALGGDDKGGD